MNEVEMLFKPVVNSFDDFFEKEENEVGCLTEELHDEIVAMYNRLGEIYVEVTQEESEKVKESNVEQNLAVVPALEKEFGMYPDTPLQRTEIEM